jgi:hypothetical protein
MAETVTQNLRGLILSAAELRQLHSDWSDAMIEDYLNLFNNFTLLSETIDDIVAPADTNLVSRAYFYGRVY